MELKFVTTNPAKFSIARRILKRYGIRVVATPMDLQELQSIDTREVAMDKARQVSRLIGNTSFMVEDSGVNIDALHGFPGALLKPVISAIGEEGLLKMMKGMGRSARFINTAVLYNRATKKFHSFTSCSRGSIGYSISGTRIPGWAIDRIFVPEGAEKPIASMTPGQRRQFSEGLAKGLHYNKVGRILSGK